MSDKPIAGLVTAAVVAPICVLCVLGPALLGSALAWLTGWFSGFSAVATTTLAIAAAILAYGYFQRRKARAVTGADSANSSPRHGPELHSAQGSAARLADSNERRH